MRYRASSLCIIRRDDAILLQQFPEDEGLTTFRPVGGTIEYGEDSRSAVVREVKQEIDEDIVEQKLVGIIENIFSHHDAIGHEYDFIYEAKFANAATYQQNIIQGIEGDQEYVAVWRTLSDFETNQNYKLVPDGLYQMLKAQEGQASSVSTIKHVNTRDILDF